MKNSALPRLLMALLVLFAGQAAHADEAEEGWEVLFDGTSTDAFRGWKSQTFPEKGWVIDPDGSLHIQAESGAGDILTKKQYASFELRFDWKVAKGSNSGVIYRCIEHDDVELSFMSGPEYQILDDDNHINGKTPRTTAASLYAHYAPNDKKKLKPIGEWNEGRIVVNGGKVEHWLNGEVVVAYDLYSEEFKQVSQRTHYKQWPHFAKEKIGHIAFQDHTDDVWYRNIRIKQLPDPEPKEQGCADDEKWEVLFDGTSTDAFRGSYREELPESWVIEDGTLHYTAPPKENRGGDIVTKKKYASFDLRWDWKISEAGNSGVKYRVSEDVQHEAFETLGLEYQVIDDLENADALNNPDHTAASLYDLYIASDKKKLNPVGEWNSSRIVLDGDKIEHWLNGELVVTCVIGSEDFRARIAKSKYKSRKGFAQANPGHIAFQDHNSKVWFRNIRIRELNAE